jgi:DNA-binding MurR/RpiR family transcriptional regulator
VACRPQAWASAAPLHIPEAGNGGHKAPSVLSDGDRELLSLLLAGLSDEAIATAERILIAGTDQMAFFASYLRHLLMLLDVRAEIAASPSQEALSRLGRIDEDTLVIGLSAGRPHPLVVRAMKIARHRKAPTLAIVDATLSEVAKLADRTLYYSSNSPAFVRSHSGLLSILQALAYGVYSRDTSQYDERIRAFKLK